MEAMSLHGGVEVLLFVMQKMIKDDAVMQLSLGLFKYLLPYSKLMHAFALLNRIYTIAVSTQRKSRRSSCLWGE
jgi:hypothetical protein